MKPNIIFIVGPPAVGKTSIAKKLSELIKYVYIDLEQFYRDYKCKTDTEKTNALIYYLDNIHHQCVIIDSFFTNSE